MKVERCKGMRDFLPADMDKFHFISEVFRQTCTGWGYEEVRTPTLEYLHLFTSAGTLTPVMLGKVYSFLDWDGWSGERVVLRPEATIPVARLFSENMAEKELAKLFYIANTFIFEENVQKNREKWQLGTELIGMGSPLADVELINLAQEIIRQITPTKIKIRLSHAGLTRGILQKLGLDAEEQNQVFDRLLDGDASVLSQIKTQKPELVPLLDLHGKTSGFVKNLAATLGLNVPELKHEIEDFVFIADSLRSLNCDFQIDIASVRGFEYYTGIIFQLYLNDEKLGGGGRYDALIPSMNGKATPASGFALYLDVLMNQAMAEKPGAGAPTKVMVVSQPEAIKLAYSISDSLRRKGYIVKSHLGGKGPPDTRWKLEVRLQSPNLILTDNTKPETFELHTAEEVINILSRLP